MSAPMCSKACVRNRAYVVTSNRRQSVHRLGPRLRQKLPLRTIARPASSRAFLVIGGANLIGLCPEPMIVIEPLVIDRLIQAGIEHYVVIEPLVIDRFTQVGIEHYVVGGFDRSRLCLEELFVQWRPVGRDPN